MPKTKTSFQKGQKGLGRPKGTPNAITKTVRDTVHQVFNDLQDDPKSNLLEFAKKFPRDFYQIAAKLIPAEVKGTMEVSGIKSIIVERASANKGK